MAAQVDQSSALEQTTSDNVINMLDPAARRRLQNRLNQRASRRRKALENHKQHNTTDRKWVIYINDSNIPKKNSSTEAATSHQVAKLSSLPRQNKENFYYFNPAQRDQFAAKLHDAKILHMLEHPVLLSSPTFCAAHFSVLRAMLINANIMGLTIELLNEDLASQFNLVGPSTLYLPASLCPSQKQKKIIHHPWIDLIPILSLREALLARADVIDEDEVCSDFYGACGDSPDVGIRVWGEAWDPFAYEASESLVRKWSWMATDCPDMIKSSNYWRKQRGEKAIVLKDIE
ncbi:hypothetical protein PENVUL_c025G04727 [Penicillium vulpinum]|uniref:BZIP domain-containing protein n=2 Tax=Penicillium vulpinum TaxID=29845 RepID=A0A1V6RV36_9EURO|nr:hypothetical protein PENVUL_c025G04727 [Penicillium vulpinum]